VESIYGSTTEVDTGYLDIHHRGYFIAEQSGTYTFTAGPVDNCFLLWLQGLAVSGFTVANTDIDLTAGPSQTYTVSLTPGIYPIRYMYTNYGGPGYYYLTITAPDGSTLLGTNGESNYLATSCSPGYPVYPEYVAP